MDGLTRPLGRADIRTIDAAIAAWVALWLVVAVIAYVEVRDLEQLSDSLATSGTALETAGSALETIGAIPIVGAGPERLGREVQSVAIEVRRSAIETRDSVATLSIVFGIAILFIPTVPVVALYLPWRAARRREAAAVQHALHEHGGDPAFEEYLARRAVQQLPLAALSGVVPDPWRALRDGRHRLLANAELTRLGITDTPRS